MHMLKPLGERVLVKHAKKEEKTKGGIYIPDSAKDDRKEGIVVSVGALKDGKELPLKPGDRVLYGGFSPEEIELNGEKHTFVEFKDILAKFE